MGIPGTLASLAVPLASLKPYAANPRQGSVEHIKESLRAHGQYRPLVVRKVTNEVLAGNHTLKAARELGWTEIAATFVECDDDEAARIVLVDNRTNDLAGYDDRLLADLLSALPDLDGTGYGQDDLAALMAKIQGPSEGLIDPDEVPVAPAQAFTKPGDLWLLGPHRLLCGDATNRNHVSRVLSGRRAELMVTDPPYGVMYGRSGSDKKNAIRGDLSQATIPISFSVALECALDSDARLYLFGGSSNWTMYSKLFDHHLHAEPCVIVWVKESFVMRPNNYHSQFEVVYFGWKGKGGGPGFWHGDRTQADVWRVARDREGFHPTQKPVEVCSIPIRNSSAPGGLVFEPFGGSGSTLIACLREGRTFAGLEVDPAYCDVIARRFQEFTDVKPILEATGEEHDFTAPNV